MDTKVLLRLYKQHIEEMLLPFWEKAADQKHGGVYTCFNNSGDRLVSRDKYTWSQGRFLWLWTKIAEMASAKRLHVDSGKFSDQAEKTARFLENNVFLDNGNCAFVLSESGEKKETEPGQGYDTSIFADCFVVLGLAKFAGFTQDQARFEKALKLHERIDERLAGGNYRSEPFPVPNGFRSHSFPMIMLNVSQELADAALILKHTEADELQQKAIDYANDIMINFYLPDHRIVEMLPENETGKSSLLYRHVNPGHALESMWFVMHTARKAGNYEYIEKSALAIEKALELGWDDKYGGILRFTDEHGKKPAGNKIDSAYDNMIMDTWSLKLWWPHSEALYAALLGFALTGNESFLWWHKKIHRYVFDTFPNPDKEIGEWIQIRNRKGEPVDKVAALPVKDPFHILRNLLLVTELLDSA